MDRQQQVDYGIARHLLEQGNRDIGVEVVQDAVLDLRFEILERLCPDVGGEDAHQDELLLVIEMAHDLRDVIRLERTHRFKDFGAVEVLF